MTIPRPLAATLGFIGAVVLLVFGVPAFLRHNTGAKQADFSGAFYALKACADSVSHDPNVNAETYGHTVNGGVHVVSSDSLHKLLPGQPVIGLTHTDIHGADTVITIYTEPPADLLVLQHEFANALSWRHRLALIGSDTGKFLTSVFYKRCVQYCPKCSAGAY